MIEIELLQRIENVIKRAIIDNCERVIMKIDERQPAISDELTRRNHADQVVIQLQRLEIFQVMEEIQREMRDFVERQLQKAQREEPAEGVRGEALNFVVVELERLQVRVAAEGVVRYDFDVIAAQNQVVKHRRARKRLVINFVDGAVAGHELLDFAECLEEM